MIFDVSLNQVLVKKCQWFAGLDSRPLFEQTGDRCRRSKDRFTDAKGRKWMCLGATPNKLKSVRDVWSAMTPSPISLAFCFHQARPCQWVRHPRPEEQERLLAFLEAGRHFRGVDRSAIGGRGRGRPTVMEPMPAPTLPAPVVCFFVFQNKKMILENCIEIG